MLLVNQRDEKTEVLLSLTPHWYGLNERYACMMLCSVLVVLALIVAGTYFKQAPSLLHHFAESLSPLCMVLFALVECFH